MGEERGIELTPWQAWLEYFWDTADFGPAHGDVIDIMYRDFKAKTGITVEGMEDE